MAGNRKTRKPGKNKVRTFTSSGKLPILFRTNPEDDRALKLMPHTDLAEIREGRGTEEGYWVVANRLNWASTLTSMVEFSFDPAPVINAGLEAMLALNKRFMEIGKFVLRAEELKAVGEALTLADDMHDATTRRQHRDALIKLVMGSPENRLLVAPPGGA